MTNRISTKKASTSVHYERFSRYEIEHSFKECMHTVAYVVANPFIHLGNFFAGAQKYRPYTISMTLGSWSKNVLKAIANQWIDFGNFLHLYTLNQRRITVERSEEPLKPEISREVPNPLITPLENIHTTLKTLKETNKAILKELPEIIPGGKPLPTDPSAFSKEELQTLQNHAIWIEQCKYIETFKEEHQGASPSEEVLAQAFSPEAIKGIKRKVREDILAKSYKERLEIRTFLEALQKGIKELKEGKRDSSTLETIFMAACGLAAGIGVTYGGIWLGNYVAEWLATSIIGFENVAICGTNIQAMDVCHQTTRLSPYILGGAAVAAMWNRAKNWWRDSKKIPTEVVRRSFDEKTGRKAGRLAQKFLGIPAVIWGVYNYYKNPYFAVSNELQAVARNKAGIPLLEKVKTTVTKAVSSEETPTTPSTFEMTYHLGKTLGMIPMMLPVVYQALLLTYTYPLYIAGAVAAAGAAMYYSDSNEEDEESTTVQNQASSPAA
jgi:hypothetical protein